MWQVSSYITATALLLGKSAHPSGTAETAFENEQKSVSVTSTGLTNGQE